MAAPIATTPCISCTRRTLLHGIGIAVAGSIVASCGGSSDTVDAGPPDAGACPTGDLCLDITKAPNTALANVNGSVVVSATVGKLIVVRTSATAVAVLSAICTHQGCQVNFVTATQHLFCPCHQAEFTLTGAVAHAPASVPLKTYTATLAGSIVTIKLV